MKQGVGQVVRGGPAETAERMAGTHPPMGSFIHLVKTCVWCVRGGLASAKAKMEWRHTYYQHTNTQKPSKVRDVTSTQHFCFEDARHTPQQIPMAAFEFREGRLYPTPTPTPTKLLRSTNRSSPPTNTNKSNQIQSCSVTMNCLLRHRNIDVDDCNLIMFAYYCCISVARLLNEKTSPHP